MIDGLRMSEFFQALKRWVLLFSEPVELAISENIA